MPSQAPKKRYQSAPLTMIMMWRVAAVALRQPPTIRGILGVTDGFFLKDLPADGRCVRDLWF